MRRLLALIALVTPAAAQSMYIESCNLGCSSGANGEVLCRTIHVFTDGDLRLRFSKPVDIASVDSSSFRVLDVTNGTMPPGKFFIEPADPQVVVFRPSVTFDAGGNPSFGFEPNKAYQILLAGAAQGDSPPYVVSLDGDPNWNRMACTVFTSLGTSGPVRRYCKSAPNSVGQGARMDWSGSTSIVDNDLVLRVTDAVPGQFGLFLLSDGQTEVPAGAGFRCIGGTVARLSPVQVVDAAGVARRALDFTNAPPGLGAALPGTVWTTQFVYRDGPGGGNFNYSDGLVLMVHP
jgi:hypothetical protein